MTLPRRTGQGMLACLGAAVLVLALNASSPAFGAEYYVDPATGSADGDGSAESPWESLEQVVQDGHFGAVIQAGDTVWLRTGFHGELVISGGSFATPITIAAAPGETPRLRRVELTDTQGWVLSGLSISPSHSPEFESVTIARISGSSSNVTIEKSLLFTVEDASGWSADDWDQLAANGITADGTNITLRENVVQNVDFAISVNASDSLVEGNVVDSYSGDGLRGLGDDITFQYNLVKNSYNVNDNHDDGFQSWSVGPGGVGTGEVRGIILRGNVFISSDDDPSRPLLRRALQGIGCFDGMFVDWIVENNVIFTDHWHGITFLGATNVRVINNTVIDIDRENSSTGPPWIQIGDHKDGTPSTGNIVRNNLTSDLNLTSSGVTEDHNLIVGVSDKDALFVDPTPPAFDVHLVPGAPAIDAGSSDLAAATDIEGNPRPQGEGVDIGAFEWPSDPLKDLIALNDALPADVSAYKSRGHMSATLARLEVVRRLVEAGQFDIAIRQLESLQRRMDGCGDGPPADGDDWIVDCTVQNSVRKLVERRLIPSLIASQ
ncbi:MAG: hypothetical protein GEU99_06285 [Luteitalea sp.]|nr:hypothetical protein [Luteitalea sp.]